MSAAPRRLALIVANDAYDDPRLRRLRAPVRDAEELARVLSDPEIGGFEVDVVLNEPEHRVRRKLSEFFAERGREDLLLLHFSCHGLKDDDGSLYFATPDSAVGHLDSTAVSAEFVNRQMRRSRSRRIALFLDCCYSGAFSRGASPRAGDGLELAERFDGQGQVVITASTATEYAFEGDELTGSGTPSVFTTAIVEGLESGDADRDGDGLVSIDELYDYVYDRVRERTPSQTPSKWTYDLQGELYVARNRNPRPAQASELPPDLRQAMENRLAFVRAGAVGELELLLDVSDRRVAAAARAALETMTADDSRSVSDAAAAVLARHAAPERALAPETAPAAVRAAASPAAADAPPEPARARRLPLRRARPEPVAGTRAAAPRPPSSTPSRRPPRRSRRSPSTHRPRRRPAGASGAPSRRSSSRPSPRRCCSGRGPRSATGRSRTATRSRASACRSSRSPPPPGSGSARDRASRSAGRSSRPASRGSGSRSPRPASTRRTCGASTRARRCSSATAAWPSPGRSRREPRSCAASGGARRTVAAASAGGGLALLFVGYTSAWTWSDDNGGELGLWRNDAGAGRFGLALSLAAVALLAVALASGRGPAPALAGGALAGLGLQVTLHFAYLGVLIAVVDELHPRGSTFVGLVAGLVLVGAGVAALRPRTESPASRAAGRPA